ncbi:MAG: flagellar hook-associated protein FlgK [Planctomycetales bacterium]|nr:flagellar hook-associated protein FlgK [Planctomycetales bacterium]
MSLFSVMNLSAQSLMANELGIRVVSNNISNANTPGYIREQLNVTPGPIQRMGNLNLGTGVRVQGIEQSIDVFVASRLREAKSDLNGGTEERDVLLEIESILGELNDNDLSSGLNRFFSSVHDIVNQPDSVSLRNVSVLEGQQLTTDIRAIDSQLRTVRGRVNDQIADGVDQVNSLLREISDLNVKILEAEGGLVSSSAAVGLRDQRLLAVEKLSELVDVRVAEQEQGTVSVYAGGEFLVFDSTYRQLAVTTEPDRGLVTNQLVLSDTNGPVDFSTGKLGGWLTARDVTLANTIDKFNDFARNLSYEFNRIFSSSQGLRGNTELTSNQRVESISAPLDEAGLAFTPESGSFSVQVRDIDTGQVSTTEIPISLQGLDDDTSLEDLAASIDSIDGLTATINANRQLVISTDRPGIEFAFADDTSGVPAALGLAGFFTGTGASDIGISDDLKRDPSLFAASQGGIGVDSLSAQALAALGDQPIESLGGLSITQIYEQISVEVTQTAAAAKAEVDGLEVFHNMIEAEHLSITGVSLDEEAIKLMTYQRSYQASARVIQTASQLLEVLVNL